MFKTILVPTDGSDHAAKAVEIASDLADKHGSCLVLLSVISSGPVPEGLRRMAEVEHLTKGGEASMPDPANLPAGMAGALHNLASDQADDLKVMTAVAQQIVDRAHETATERGVGKIVALTLNGDPAATILQTAERQNADAIVMGSRGLSDLKGLIQGSVSHKVSQLSKCTCVTVK